MEYFNHKLYMEILSKRKELGLPGASHNISIDHPLIGKTLVSSENGNKYLVVSANKQYYGGWYIGLLLNCVGSHRFVFWENINSIDESIMDGIYETRDELTLQEKR